MKAFVLFCVVAIQVVLQIAAFVLVVYWCVRAYNVGESWLFIALQFLIGGTIMGVLASFLSGVLSIPLLCLVPKNED